MFSSCFEYIDATRLHGRASLVRIDAATGQITLFAPVAGSASECPGLIVTVEKNYTFEINYYIIKTIYHLVALFPVYMKEKSIGIGIKNFAHLIRVWRIRRAAEVITIEGAAELTLHSHPRCGKYF
jgi:hypothetical protein